MTDELLPVGADSPIGLAIRCRRCGHTSYHPEDVRQRYCGACHRFHDDPEPPPEAP